VSRLTATLRAQRSRAENLMARLMKDSESYDGRVSDDLGRLWERYLKEYRWRIFAAFAITLVWSTHGYIFALATQYLVDEVIKLGTGIPVTLEEQMPGFYRWAGIVLGTWTLVVVTQWVRSRLILGVGQSLVYRLRAELHEKLQVLHIGYFERQETGKLMSRVLEDVWIIREWSSSR